MAWLKPDHVILCTPRPSGGVKKSIPIHKIIVVSSPCIAQNSKVALNRNCNYSKIFFVPIELTPAFRPGTIDTGIDGL